MPAPVIIPLATMAGSAIASLFGSSNAANASAEAARIQAAAANRASALAYAAGQDALDFEKQQWATSQSALQPYVQAGQGAVSKLSHLLGIAGVSPTNWTAPTPVGSSGTSHVSDLGIGIPIQEGPAPATGGRTVPYGSNVVSIGQAVLRNPADPRASTLANLPPGTVLPPSTTNRGGGGGRTTPGRTNTPIQASGSAVARDSGGGTVTMRAPDGTEQDVPAEYVEYYQSLGAEVV